MKTDFLIVGSGLTGATIARMLVEAGYQVIVVERRDHVGGNVHDRTHRSGVRIHTYGPHYFRTNSERIWGFVNRFAPFYPYRPSILSLVNGRHESWPVTESYLKTVVGSDWQPNPPAQISNFEEACLSMMPETVYQKFVKGYTEKQWGTRAANLDANLARRFDVRRDNQTCLSRSRFQGIPENGYAAFMRNMLAGIPVQLHFDYLEDTTAIRARIKTIFTGPIDEFFGFVSGSLAYRAQRRVHHFLQDVDTYQPGGQVNNPDPATGSFIRTLEWKHMMPAHIAAQLRGTVITREYPFTPSNPDHNEYPFPDARNRALYEKYASLAASQSDVLFCGRLGEYRYLDMDQAIARAMMLATRLITAGRSRSHMQKSA